MTKELLRSPHLPLLATTLVLVALFGAASSLYPSFFTMRVVANIFGDNAFLGIAAIGMTFVILSGGIDLSVGSVLAFTTIFVATLIDGGLHPMLAIPPALLVGTLFGAFMGTLIARYDLPPFLVTLGGMFFARGMAYIISTDSVRIRHPMYRAVQDFGIPLTEKATLPATGVIFVVMVIVGVLLLHFTRFGRNVYAVGGNESSARLMGLPVGMTKVAVYTFSGFCAALAGVTATFYMGSGNPALGFGFELDAIASVVIGGTLLTGGVGTVLGTLAGVLIFGTIQTALVFDGRLSSWWLRIAIGVLLLGFILFQRILSRLSTLAAESQQEENDTTLTRPPGTAVAETAAAGGKPHDSP
jgi:galactofuranose transport system permease protein